MSRIAFFDETPRGERTPAVTVRMAQPPTTVRDLIAARVAHEVDRHNAAHGSEDYRGLVHPADAEPTVHGCRLPNPRPLDVREQLTAVFRAFEALRVFVFVDEQRVDSLDQPIEVRDETAVSFVKVVDLTGG